VSLRSVLQLLVTANAIPSSLILFTLMMLAIRSSKISALTKTTEHQFPEEGTLYIYWRENFKSYIVLTGWGL
jgi:hypothetical protein